MTTRACTCSCCGKRVSLGFGQVRSAIGARGWWCGARTLAIETCAERRCPGLGGIVSSPASLDRIDCGERPS
eukprot:9475017-Pyramimonas_sp.AAC.2